jgi:hypothetical protein
MLYIEDYGIPIPQILKDMNYVIPKFCTYKDDYMEIKALTHPDEFVLFLNNPPNMGGLNHRNMGYKLDHSTALGFMSYYDLAYGHVILTGLGLGIVATWLSDKPEVTKITVVENNIHLINYFKTYGDLPNKVELIHEDADRYVGKCDVLLCSHLIMSPINGQKTSRWLKGARMLDNIECDILCLHRIPKIVKTYENYLKTRIKIPQLPYITEEKFVLYKLYT